MVSLAKENFPYSPYLTRLARLYPECLEKTADGALAVLEASLVAIDEDQKSLMQRLRVAKGKLALIVAAADIGGKWPLEKITAALSEFAEHAVRLALDHLLAAAHERGEIVLPHPEAPSQDSGIIILAMGKLGARELNYSSDIDLMMFFERGHLPYHGRHNEQHFMNKLAHDLVHILQERTADGYVFRTDLRLRPDPASTPPAIATAAAHYYYESVGQNWERAAMIKARPVAGDFKAGEEFLKHIAPFMWRRNLDFAALTDIHSIKRQMDSHRHKTIELAGHNIKLGIGGIREIEFFVQIHQLIWGGRQPSLRVRSTCEALDKLVELKLAEPDKAEILKDAYVFLRTLEHRLQMIDDEQTHTFPKNGAEIENIAKFMEYASAAALEKEVIKQLSAVHEIYAASFQSAEKLGDIGNLVFTGVAHDPDTLTTLKGMNYVNPETVSEIVMGWHHGSCRATRTKRARELLTELMPALLKRLSETANPDAAFLRFNEFLKDLPAGVQLFSLFNANPPLLGLIADIMGSAPTLASILSKSPNLLDAVLYADFYEPPPDYETLAAQWKDMASLARDFEERMRALRRFRNEKQFQAGVHLLKGMIDARQTGNFLSSLADLMTQETLHAISQEFEKNYGKIKKARFAVIGLGKLGSRELTFNSDIDLIFVYDAPIDAISSGEKGLNASVYYNRLAQRLVNSLSAMDKEGKLYDVDTRLRPSGGQGLLAVSMNGLEKYFDESAWTFESMALTKARPVAGDNTLQQEITTFIQRQLVKPRDKQKLKIDTIEMRTRIEKEYGDTSPWNIKYVRGGLIDVDFIAQYLLLFYAPDTPGAKAGAAADIYRWLKADSHLSAANADMLIEADRFLGQIFNMLRLCNDGDFDEAQALPGLQKLLCKSVNEPDFEALKQRLIAIEARVLAEYNALLAEGETL